MISRLRTLLTGQTAFSGGALLLVSMTVVNAGNYLYNLVLGRWLGPAAFADLSLIVTLMLMVTFITAALQLTAAKFAAAYSADGAPGQLADLRHWLQSWAWRLGGVLAVIIIVGARQWQAFFHTQSPWPFVILGLGAPVYFLQGIDRGVLQGQIRFGRLSLSYVAEMIARLGLGLLFVAVGWSVNGAVAGISLSFVATWLTARGARHNLPAPQALAADVRGSVLRYAGPVVVVYLSQILINNSDILIVKRFFESAEAGLYAALALIGRVVFFATWSVVTTLFPLVAQKHQRGESHHHLLVTGLGLVGVISVGIVGATALWPELIVRVLFGPAYLAVAPLLWLYAVATMLYALANVVINYRLSADNPAGTYLATAAGAAQVGLLWLFHASLRQVIVVQIGLMAGLLAVVLLWDSWLAYLSRRRSAALAATG